MPTITVKNIPADLYEKLKEAASANRRSMNSEIIRYIERGVRGRAVDVDAVFTRARELRRKTKRHPVKDATLRKARNSGRP